MTLEVDDLQLQPVMKKMSEYGKLCVQTEGLTIDEITFEVNASHHIVHSILHDHLNMHS